MIWKRTLPCWLLACLAGLGLLFSLASVDLDGLNLVLDQKQRPDLVLSIMAWIRYLIWPIILFHVWLIGSIAIIFTTQTDLRNYFAKH